MRLAAYGEPVDGTPFGLYLLVELLGRGGMGEVWPAERRVLPLGAESSGPAPVPDGGTGMAAMLLGKVRLGVGWHRGS